MRVEDMSSHDDAWTGICRRRSSGGGSRTSSTLPANAATVHHLPTRHDQNLSLPQLNILLSSPLGPPAIAPLISSHL
jgi:hypothetical protein